MFIDNGNFMWWVIAIGAIISFGALAVMP